MAMLSDKLRSGQNFYSAQKARDIRTPQSHTPVPSEIAPDNKKRLHPINLVGLNKVNAKVPSIAPAESYGDKASNPPSPRTLMEL